MMNQDDATMITSDLENVTIHKFKYDDTMVKLVQVDDRFDVSQIVKIANIKWDHLIKSKKSLWEDISKTIMDGAPAIITYKCKIVGMSTRTLHCVPEQLLSYVLTYCKNDELGKCVVDTITKANGCVVKQFNELECKIATDPSTNLTWAMSERMGNFCNVSLVIEAAKKTKDTTNEISRGMYSIGDFTKKASTITLMNTIIANEKDSGYDSHKSLYYKKYGVQWMHSKLAIAFAMDMSPSYRYSVLSLVDRISSGDCTVIGDVLQTIDDVNGTKTLAELYTYDIKVLEENKDASDEYESKLAEIEDKYLQSQRALGLEKSAHHGTMVRYNGLRTSLDERDSRNDTLSESMQLIMASSNVGEDVTRSVLRHVGSDRGNSVNEVFNSVNESNGYFRKTIGELTEELHKARFEANDYKSKYETELEEKITLNDMINDTANSVDRVMKYSQSCQKVISAAVGRITKDNPKAVLSIADIKILAPAKYGSIKVFADAVTTESKIIQDGYDRAAQAVHTEDKLSWEVSKHAKPDQSFEFNPVRSPTTDNKGPIYMYIKPHVPGSYLDWVRYTFGEPFISNRGFSVMLCDSSFTKLQENGLIFAGSFHRTTQRLVADDKEVERRHAMSTMDLIIRLANSPALCKKSFGLAQDTGRVMLCDIKHPKYVERELMDWVKPFFSHKINHLGEVIKKWNNWIVEYVPIQPVY